MFFLIGHRGVGKTSLIKSLIGSAVNAVDLDESISETYNISETFEEHGESAFRDIERESLDKILKDKPPSVVALGAGFELDKYKFPKGSRFIWIQRDSDSAGRIFFDRPRLEKSLGPLDEFKKRKFERDKIFHNYSDFNLALEEGDFSLAYPTLILKSLFNKKLVGSKRGYFTPRTEFELEVFHGSVEFRTDFFKKDKILDQLSDAKFEKKIVSVRTKEALDLDFLKQAVSKGALIDMPLEYTDSKDLIENFKPQDAFLSLHKNMEFDEFKKIESPYSIKWAPELDRLETVIQINESLDERYSFLPRSKANDGSFKWLRLIRSNKIEFFRYGQSENLDQPLYFESIDFKRESIGGVIGEDTRLSWSPATHRRTFIEKYGSHYLNISCPRVQMTGDLFYSLSQLGVRYLSVTSPFKKSAGDYVSKKPLNTLDLKEKRGLNTDVKAVQHWSNQIRDKGLKKVLIFGSGEMGKAFKKELKEKAVLMSARDKSFKSNETFDALIWASGPKAEIATFLLNMPSSFDVIYDLDYKEESKGRLLALQTGALYISGYEFFQIQAQAQSQFFKGEL